MTEERSEKQRLRDQITQRMIDIAENGEPIITDDGHEVRKTPSASMMGQIIKWYQHLSQNEQEVGGDLTNLARRMADGGHPMPDLDMEGEDDATK